MAIVTVVGTIGFGYTVGVGKVVGGGGDVSATGISTVSTTFVPVIGFGGRGGAEATGTADTLVDSESVSVLGISEAI